MVRIRSSLAAAEAYVAGKQAPSRRLPPGVAPVRLAANESPFGPLPGVRAVMIAALDAVNRYPEPSGRVLRAAIAAFHGLALEQVLIGPGAGSLCERAVLATCGEGDELMFGWPSFIGYRNYATVAGARAVAVPLDGALRYDLDAMADAVGPQTRAVIVCNPNNPTGTAVGGEAMASFLREVPDDCLVILDEAYIEFADPRRCALGRDLIGEFENLIVARTFSKAYGLAGLRAGYLFGQAGTVALVARTMTPFQINSVGQAAALACLEARAEMTERAEVIRAGREWLGGRLRALGYPVPECQGNFVWVPMSGDEATEAARALESRGVLTRPFPGGLRITVGTDEENRLVEGTLTAADVPR